jgi:hypothetical protein
MVNPSDSFPTGDARRPGEHDRPRPRSRISRRVSTPVPTAPTTAPAPAVSTVMDGARMPLAVLENQGEGEPTRAARGEPLVKEKGSVYAHPVHLTFLIAMPDPRSPSYNAKPSVHPFSTGTSTSPNLPLLSLGTTYPTARLPSILMNRDDLDSWWDLPAPPNVGRFNVQHQYRNVALPNGQRPAPIMPGRGNPSAGQVLQIGIVRVAAERGSEEGGMPERERERVVSGGVGGRGPRGVGANVNAVGGGREGARLSTPAIRGL